MESFGDGWHSWDPGEAHEVYPARALIEYIRQHPKVQAISSHTVRPPFPAMDDVRIYPLLFLRHPILRAASMYKYERSLNGETESQRVAMHSTFPQYVRWRLRPDEEPVIRDFQTIYLSGEQCRYEDPRHVVATGSAFARATALLEEMPVFGIVEHFAESIRLFGNRLKHVFPQIRWREAHENVTGSWLGTLEAIRTELGDDLYLQLENSNASDLALYKRAMQTFEQRQLQLPL